MKTSRSMLCLSLLGVALQPTSGLASDDGPDVARYQVRFERGWTSESHPADFPLLAHFSPVIGFTHAPGRGPLMVGATASDGVEKLCEEGKHQPLDAEIRTAIGKGDVGALIETGDPIRDDHGRAVTDFEIDAGHSQVSIAAMIAPSPDWCAAALDVDLREDGRWVSEKQVSLYSYDVGTDSATSYRALDHDMKPRGPIQPNAAPYFNRDGRATPVGTVTFVRK